MTTAESPIPVDIAIYMALGFVVLIVIVTAILLLCYWYNCLKAIYIWMGLAVALLLSFYVLVGVGNLPAIFNIPLDYIALAIFLLNLVIVGVMAIFWRAPEIITQSFMILISVLTALVFLTLPDWTVWILLVLLIFYDMTVVLCPNGLLNLIIKKTEERGDALPALIYSSAAYVHREHDEEEDQVFECEEDDEEGNSVANAFGEEDEDEESSSTSNSTSSSGSKGKLFDITDDGKKEVVPQEENYLIPVEVNNTDSEELKAPETAPVENAEEKQKSTEFFVPEGGQNNADAPKEEEANKQPAKKRKAKRPAKQEQAVTTTQEEQPKKKPRRISRKDGVKLGLGDFIFYGILITRAARVGWDISVLCMLAVVLGLSLTLVCLAIFERPLPALPFSLFLGIIFYITGAMTFRPFSLNLRHTSLVL